MQRVKMMKKYADLIIRNGLNTQARQDVAIIANAEMHTFVGYFVAELYKMHVHSVADNRKFVTYSDGQIRNLATGRFHPADKH